MKGSRWQRPPFLFIIKVQSRRMRPEGERQVRDDARKIKRALAGLFVLLLALCLSAGLYVGLKGYGMYREALEQKPLAEMAEQVRAQPDFTPLGRAAPAVPGRCGGRWRTTVFIPMAAWILLRCAVRCGTMWWRGRFCGGGAPSPSACQKPVFHTGEGAHAQGGRGVHGMGHREAVYQGRDPGAVCEFHLFRQRIL